MKKSIAFKIIALIFIFYLSLLQSAEIFYEKDWYRIVSGDYAARITRQFAQNPTPHDITIQTLDKILSALHLPAVQVEIEAWRQALRQYGWAQSENEPERSVYRSARLFIKTGKKLEIHAALFNIWGIYLSARFTLNGELIEIKNIKQQEIIDQSVFFTIRTAPLFVMNQEHFQKQFFEQMLNLNKSDLIKVKQAYGSGKTLLAAYEISEYFRRLKHPIWQNRPPAKIKENDPAADMVVRHEFAYKDSIIHFGKRIDYRNNPTPNSEWLWRLNDMHHWITLLNGYENTANEVYAREFNRDVMDWTVRNPAPLFRLTRVPSWRNLEAGDRMAYTWPHAFFGFLASPSFQPQAVQLMLAAMWSHGRHIIRFPSGLHFASNWSIVESNGLADLGMYFPEFSDAKTWINTGFKRLSNQMKLQIYPDGVQHELSPGYHYYCLRSFYKAYDTAKKTDNSVPADYTKILNKMFEYLMYISAPDRMTPPSNDADRFSVKAAMKLGAKIFKRQDMLFIASDGAKGTAPQKTSFQFPWAGQCVMRSDWSPQAYYLFFDAGPTGVNHQHEDKLHFDISAFGRLFFVDGGRGSYVPDKWRRYLISTQAHNTIVIDGKGQHRIPQKQTHRAKAPMKNQWISDKNIDLSAGTYNDGYGEELMKVSHSRYIIFKKSEYWLIIDILKGEGRHKFESFYHFVPCELKIDRRNNTVETQFSDGKNIKIALSSTVATQINIVEGSENPEQGWTAYLRKREAAPAVVLSGRSSLPQVLTAVIFPFENNSSPKLSIKINEYVDNQINIVVTINKNTDHWLVNLNGKNNILLDDVTIKEAVRFKRTINGSETERFTARYGD